MSSGLDGLNLMSRLVVSRSYHYPRRLAQSFDRGFGQGIYPTVIILLVAVQRSTPDTVFTVSQAPNLSLEPMRFSASPTGRAKKSGEISDSDLFTNTTTPAVSSRDDTEHEDV